MITGKELVEKMYSENYDEYEDTRLYSTGDGELDDLLERAFCEGYEYAQKEFGNKENKAAKRAYELQYGKKYIRGLKLDKDEAEKSALGMYRAYNNDYQFPEEIKNVNQSINYKSRYAKRFEKELHSDDSKKSDLDKVVDRGVAKNILDSEFGARGSLEEIKDKGKKYKRNLKFNKAKRDINKFVKDNKKGLAIGSAALGAAALVGGIAINRARKKKKAAKEENDNTKK